MNFRTFMKSVLMTALLLGMMSIASFAQVYVNNTNGDDLVGQGTQNLPYKTIAKGISAAPAGGIVSITADTYNEGGAILVIDKPVTLVSTTYNGLSTVTIANGVEINTTNATDVVKIGRTEDGSQAFLLGPVAAANALVLTKGNLQISTANVSIASGKTIVRTAGTLDNSPTVTNVNVTYSGTTDVTAGGELPANLGAGVLTSSVPVNKTVTVSKNVAFGNGSIVNNASGSLVITGNVTFTATANLGNVINNTTDGKITLNGTINFVKTTSGASNYTATLLNNGTGTLILSQGFIITPGTVSGTTYRVNVAFNNASTGKLVLGAASVAGASTNAGTVELVGTVTYTAATLTNTGATIKLGANTLNIGAGVTIANAGGAIVSTTAGTVGAGSVAITSATGAALTINGGEIPSVTIASGRSLTTSGALVVTGDLTSNGAVTLGGNLTLAGNYAQNTGASLNFGGANIFEVWGNWVRTSNVPGDVTFSTGQLLFKKGNAQLFTPGASLKLYDVTINKDAGTVATMTASLEVARNFTVTAGKLDLGDYNVRMTGATGTFTNEGNFFTTSGNGYIIFEGAAAAYNITGTGTFSNMDIRAGATVTALSHVGFSGSLILRNGTLAMGAFNFTFKNDVVPVPSVTRHALGHMTVGAGTIACATGVLYDLTYIGDANATSEAEWIAGGIRNLTIDTGDKNSDVTLATSRTVTAAVAGASFSIAGNLTVNVKQTLDLNGKKIVFAADNTTHNIVGRVVSAAPGYMEVTGNNVAVNGSTATGAQSEITRLDVSTATGETFTSNNLIFINGDLNVADGASTIKMNAKTATITGDVTLTAGALNLNMDSEASTHTGDLTVTAGTLTYARQTGSEATVANQTLTGNVTLTDGTLKLGSCVVVTGVTSQVKGNIDLNGSNYTVLGSVASPDFVRTDAGAVTGEGTLVFDATGAALDVTPGATFTVAKVQFKGDNTTTVNAAMTVSNSLTFTSSNVVFSGIMTVSGSSVLYETTAGTITGTLNVTGNTTITGEKAMTIPVLVVNTADALTFATDDVENPRTFTVGNLTQTLGTIAQGANNVVLTGPFTRVEGSWTQGDGVLNFNTAGAIAVGDGFAVDNMQLSQSADFGTKSFTVRKYLTLAAGTLTTSADGKLVLADGATIERQANGTTLSKLPAFGANTNVAYTTAGAAITTAKELPATVKDFVVDLAAGGKVVLAVNVTVTGTLSLNKLLDATTTANVKVTMANNSTLELKDDGTTVLDENLTRAGKLNIVYNGAANTTTRELGPTTNATTHTAGNVTFQTDVVLDAKATFTGEVKFDGGSLDNNGVDLYLEGDITETENGGFFAPTAASNLYFSGNTNTKITLDSDKEIPANLNVTIKKTNGTNTITMVSGNLDFHANAKKLVFNNGLLVTGANYVKLWAPLFGNGQGFERGQVVVGNTSHIVGNVKKQLVNNGTVAGSTEQRSEFPVGSLQMYRQVAITFNPQNGLSNVPNRTLIVSHVDNAPTGTVGLPIANGISEGVNVSRYPEFFWTINSETSGISTIVFDLELGAAGFTDFTNIADIRTIRRIGSVNDITNPWYIQGGISTSKYDNNIISEVPTIVVRDAQGGIVAGGATFTLGLKTNMVVANPIAAQTLTVGGNAVKVALKNPAVVSGNLGTLTYTAQSSNASVATVAVANDTLTVTPVAAGSAEISVTAKDVNNDFITTKFVATVNAVTKFNVAGKVAYANTAVTGLSNVVVKLTSAYSATTAADGSYSILNVENGTYTATAASPNPWLSGAVNSADALLVAQYTVNPAGYPLSALQVSAADVNNDNVVNSRDALLIMRRVVRLDSTFVKGDWTFTTKAVSVAGAHVTNVNISALAVGDVNANATFTATLAKAQFVNEGSVKVNPGAAIAVPVKVDASNLAALTLQFKYSKDLGTFAGVSSKLPGLLANESNGVVTIAWADLSAENSVNATVEEALLTLNFKPSEAFKAGKSFSVDAQSAELVSADGKVMNATLKSSTVDAVVPSVFALNQNYPNPFNPTTTISYDLPVNAKVSLVVFNVLGQEVATLVNGVQEAGSHKVQFNAQNLTSGMYIYTLHVTNGDQKFTQTHKMILMK